jgi:hypothetical protein
MYAGDHPAWAAVHAHPATSSKRLERTNATRLLGARASSHLRECELHWNDEVVARLDTACANHRARDANRRERSRGSWAAVRRERHRDRKSERDLVGERSRGRKCDRRADYEHGCLYRSDGTAESEHDNGQRRVCCRFRRERHERRDAVERDAGTEQRESGNFHGWCVHTYFDRQSIRGRRASAVRRCGGYDKLCFGDEAHGDRFSAYGRNICGLRVESKSRKQ